MADSEKYIHSNIQINPHIENVLLKHNTILLQYYYIQCHRQSFQAKSNICT